MPDNPPHLSSSFDDTVNEGVASNRRATVLFVLSPVFGNRYRPITQFAQKAQKAGFDNHERSSYSIYGYLL